MITKSKTRKASSLPLSKPLKRSSKSTAPLAKTHAGLTFVRRFQNALAKNQLLPRGSRIVVAVSGGPDSMVLLSLLERLREKHAFTLHVAHVNYGLRGQDSDRDAQLVAKFCAAENISFSVLHSQRKPKKNIEATLRTLRYTWFEELRKRLRYDVIVTAHTLNDVAETFLLNLLRGSGALGLSPFQRIHSHLARPLLSFPRRTLEAYLQAEQIPFRIDKSNSSKRFTRNRIRHELIPLLETFNPSILTTIATTAHLLNLRTLPRYRKGQD